MNVFNIRINVLECPPASFAEGENIEVAKAATPERRLEMSEEPTVGCARPTGGMLGQPEESHEEETVTEKKEDRTMIQVGKPAPDFVAPAYHKGEFTQVKLSDHLGKWVVLCFYPGDFTFV